jgi:hypothetical protein
MVQGVLPGDLVKVMVGGRDGGSGLDVRVLSRDPIICSERSS